MTSCKLDQEIIKLKMEGERADSPPISVKPYATKNMRYSIGCGTSVKKGPVIY